MDNRFLGLEIHMISGMFNFIKFLDKWDFEQVRRHASEQTPQ